ncbi:hypothetical protein LCGC14_2073680 [marine sediment metagenome]|uniref:Uncharacterized protein n=1 Tax=marine sediment metagenome TaxID=412755 RepID=A0A0F9EHV3_9ZZZZ
MTPSYEKVVQFIGFPLQKCSKTIFCIFCYYKNKYIKYSMLWFFMRKSEKYLYVTA